LYAAATFYQGTRLANGAKANKRLLVTLGVLAVLAHGASLFTHLLTPIGLGLDFFSAASLIAAAVIALTLLACSRIPVENLLVLLFPLGAATALLAQFAPAGTVQIIDEAPGILAHILLSILAYGMFTIAVFQALLLLMQDHQLKHKHPSGLIKNFPPLQTMESLLFGFLGRLDPAVAVADLRLAVRRKPVRPASGAQNLAGLPGLDRLQRTALGP
jgi:ABC-type uncharacterized transport system permease subunit